MKIRLVLLTTVLLMASVCTSVARVKLPKTDRALLNEELPGYPPAAASTLPDLIVISVDSDNLDNGVVKVKIKNQGQRKAARSLVALTMTWGSKTLSFARTDSGQLSPGQTDIVTFDVKLSLVQAKFCATADSTNRVIESNEDNNKLCGQFEGKP